MALEAPERQIARNSGVAIEVEARDSVMAEQVRMVAEDASEALDATIEFADEF
jgi:hypothetical protein